MAFNDSVKADNFYEPGEGLGGVTITAKRSSDGAIFTTQTWSAGGYTLALSAGAYQITASGAGLSGTINDGVVNVGQQNVEADFDSATANVIASPPTAILSAKNLTACASGYIFTVTYTGPTALNTSTFDKHDLTVTGPDGFRESATFVAVKSSNGGKTQSVTYRVAAPAKKWTSANNGVYHVYVRADQVSDEAGNSVLAALLGYFKIRIS